MIKAEEISAFLRKKEKICNSVESCEECPITEGKGRCTNVNLTQKQVDLIMAFEPPVDWSKVPVDAEVLVRNNVRQKWLRSHFAGFHDGLVETWAMGTTSWTSAGLKDQWKCAKLAEEDE